MSNAKTQLNGPKKQAYSSLYQSFWVILAKQKRHCRKPLILSAKLNQTMFGFATQLLIPGTELRELVKSYGWKMSEKWELYNTMNPIFEDPAFPAKEIAEMRKNFYNKFYSPKYVMRQAVKGYLKGNLYSKIMTRTAANYMLWRAMARFSRM